MIVALLAATGTHWMLLQSVAWTTMLADNLRNGSFVEAVEKTFDGQHPCSLCKRISAEKKSEKKADFPPSAQRLEFISKRTVFVFAAPSDFRVQPESSVLVRQLAHKPPTPPPRALFS
jgi:hypothetical protein